jgi:translation initiation factor IF-1
MPSNENVSLRGVIVRTLPNTTWIVKIPGDQEIVAYLSGKLRINNIRLEPGDEVEIHLSPYSLEKGRIVYRY